MIPTELSQALEKIAKLLDLPADMWRIECVVRNEYDLRIKDDEGNFVSFAQAKIKSSIYNTSAVQIFLYDSHAFDPDEYVFIPYNELLAASSLEDLGKLGAVIFQRYIHLLTFVAPSYDDEMNDDQDLNEAILRPPPKMVSKLVSWFIKAYASAVSDYVDLSELPETTSLIDELIGKKKIAVEMRGGDLVAESFAKIDLADWKHKDIVPSQSKNLKLQLQCGSRRGAAGTFSVFSGMMSLKIHLSDHELNVLAGHKSDEQSINVIWETIDHIKSATVHEVNHLAQYLLAQGVNARKGTNRMLVGGPGKTEPISSDNLPKLAREMLKPHEFQTYLRQSLEDYKQRFDNQFVREEFLTFVDAKHDLPNLEDQKTDHDSFNSIGADEFFSTLKTYDRKKWQYAVSLLYRALTA